MKYFPAVIFAVALAWLGYIVGVQTTESAVRTAQWEAEQKLHALKLEKDARIMQLERMLAAEKQSAEQQVTTIRDVRDIPASGYTATYRGQPGYGGRWDIEPARYPPVSSMNRIGGGR